MNIPNATAVTPAPHRITTPDSASIARLSPGSDKSPGLQTLDTSKTTRPDGDSDKDTILEAVRQVEKFVSLTNSEIKFSVDEDTGMSIVRVIDKATDQVIRQIPSEEVVAIARTLDKLQGLLFTGKA